jgi:hypothetical protein
MILPTFCMSGNHSLTAGVVLGAICFAIEFASLLAGVSLFLPKLNAFCKLLHLACSNRCCRLDCTLLRLCADVLADRRQLDLHLVLVDLGVLQVSEPVLMASGLNFWLQPVSDPGGICGCLESMLQGCRLLVLQVPSATAPDRVYFTCKTVTRATR